MPKLSFGKAMTIAYRVLVVVALLSIAWSLRSIDRYQYTGPSYDQEQHARQVTSRLEDIDKTLSYIEKNTRR